MTTDLTATIAANLKALDSLLLEAAQRSSVARQHIERGERNAAIGSILPLEQMLADAAALYRAAVTLQRIAGRP